MKKIMNDAENVVDEMLDGFVSAYANFYERHPEVNGVLYKKRKTGKVSLVIGGGTGHEPMFAGFVGKGLADAAVCGNIFASPDPNTICEVAKAAESGEGTLFIYGNYSGDGMNFDMAEEFLNEEGIITKHIRVTDDVASAPRNRIHDRRGIAGNVYVMKIAGAACEDGLALDEVYRIAKKANDVTKTIGVATSPGQIPGLDAPNFTIAEDEIEYGMGIHGEPGIKTSKMLPADQLVDALYDNLLADAGFKKGDEVCVLINGLGSTTILELSIVFRRVKQRLGKDGIKIYDSDLNSFCTCQEMGGFSITLLRLDAELKRYYNAPCFSPFYAKEGKE